MVTSNIRISKILLFTVFVAAIAGLVFVSFAADEDSSAYETFVDGYYTYSIDGESEVTLISYSGEVVSNVTVPETVINKDTGISYRVSGIGNNAFFGKTNIQVITIGDTVTYIGSKAFMGCSGLNTVTIGVNVREIQYEAFSECSNLVSIEIPQNVITIKDGAFKKCTSLTNIVFRSLSYYEICSSTFEGCTRLASFDIPSTVIDIDSKAFYKCSSLKTVNIPEESRLLHIYDDAFGYCSSLKTIDFKTSLTSVGSRSFEYCTSLTDIKFPSRMSAIGDMAFYNCIMLKSLIIPKGMSKIGAGAFGMCSSLNSITVETGSISFRTESTALYSYNETRLIFCPSNVESIFIPNLVTTIDSYAFSGCDLLKEINIPSSVSEIGDRAFMYCSSLKSISLSENVINIGEDAFFMCDSLESISVDKKNTSYYTTSEGVLYNATASMLIKCPDRYSGVFNVSSQVTSISDTALFNCRYITEFTVDPSSKYFAADSSGVLYDNTYGKLIAYPNSNTSTTYTIRSTVSNISEYAFGSCLYLKDLTISTENKLFSTLEGVLYSYDQKTLCYYPSGRTDSAFAIITGVTEVRAYAFCHCGSLKNLGFVYGTIDYAPSAVSIGSFEHKSEVTLKGPTGYVFPTYAFNKYTDVPHPEEDKPFISNEVLLAIGIILGVVIIVVIYIRRRYAY